YKNVSEFSNQEIKISWIYQVFYHWSISVSNTHIPNSGTSTYIIYTVANKVYEIDSLLTV
ncbi:MAG: hypothetical protein QN784_02525, partial [Nitrososphaeraceae archaeon]|nr:hypothetical protein [Nitrososphaeraceae archaeon]